MTGVGDARGTRLEAVGRTPLLEHAVGPAVVVVAAAMCLAIDRWLSSRVAAGVDTAQQLAPLYPYLGVDRSYVLARALGMTALLLAALAVALGLVAPGPDHHGPVAGGPLRGLHRSLGLVTVVLVVAHALVPYASVFPPFGGWSTATVPFAQPYSWGTTAEWAESAGIVALYLMVLVGPTYYVARRWRRGWRLVHHLALVTYMLAVAHTLLLGSDFLIRGSLRLALIGAQVPLLALLARRLPHWPAVAVWALTAGAGAVTVAGVLGADLGGFPLHGTGS